MVYLGLLGVSVAKNPPASAGDVGLLPVLGRPWRRKWRPTPVFLPGESHGQGSLEGYCHGVEKAGHDLVTEHQHGIFKLFQNNDTVL